MPYLYISQDDSRVDQQVSITHSIPPQTVSLVGYSISFHDASNHQMSNNPFNSILFVRMPWVKNRDVLCSRNDNDVDASGNQTNKDFANGVIPLLIDNKPNAANSFGSTFVPACHGLDIDLAGPINQSFTCSVFVKDKSNQYVRYSGYTPHGSDTKIEGYCKVKLLFSYLSGASY